MGCPIPIPMTIEEIQGVIKAFGQAAKRAQMAGFDLVEIHDLRVIDIQEHRPGAQMDERFHRGKGGVAGNDDLVAGTDPLKLVQQINNQRPGRAQNALLGAGVSGQLGLKGLAFLSQDILAGADGPKRGLLHFRIHETFR